MIGRDVGVTRNIATSGQTTFSDGQPAGFVGAAIDMTARRNTEAAIRASEAQSYRPDGTTARSEGETSEADSAAIMTPAPNVLVLNRARAKMPGSVRVFIVSASGNEMIESAAALDAQGEPFVRNFHYTRLR